MTLIIALAGRKQSGKTTSSQFIQKLISEYNLGISKIYNFADPLKDDICINMLGLTHDQCYGNDDAKNSLTDIRWENLPMCDKSYMEQQDYHSSGFMTARQVMQVIGTDIFRKMKNNVWTAATIKKINKDNIDFAIVADCRFPNEVDSVRKAGGYIIKLTRNPFGSTHASEVALDPEYYDQNNFDLVINNENGDIENRNNTIVAFLKNKGMILS